MEDERHNLTIEHFEESRELQEENMVKQREFYDEGKRLQDEMIALQREYWKEMHALQLAAAGAQAQYAEDMRTVEDLMQRLSQEQEDLGGKFKMAVSDTDLMINAVISGLNHVISHAPAAIRSMIPAITGESDPERIPTWTPRYPSGGGGGGGGGGSGGPELSPTSWNGGFNGGGGSNVNPTTVHVTNIIGGEKFDEHIVRTVENNLRVSA
jgi:hypothetical protein